MGKTALLKMTANLQFSSKFSYCFQCINSIRNMYFQCKLVRKKTYKKTYNILNLCKWFPKHTYFLFGLICKSVPCYDRTKRLLDSIMPTDTKGTRRELSTISVSILHINGRSITLAIIMNKNRFNHKHCHESYCLQLLCGEILTVIYC